MTTTGAVVEPALVERLRGAFGEEGLIELTALVAVQNLDLAAMWPRGLAVLASQAEVEPLAELHRWLAQALQALQAL